ncbi:hypothetical protein [Acetomicrobium sp.]|uniref:hypothetical protein n=1 Tax=Acetomicrobium sp. TaxID=1872099 RepID=UPI003D9587B1
MIDSGQLEALLERLAMRSGSEVVPVSALRKFNASSLLRRIESSLMQMDSASRSLTDTFKLA